MGVLKMGILDDLFQTTRDYERKNKTVDKDASICFGADIIANKMCEANNNEDRKQYLQEAIDYVYNYLSEHTREMKDKDGNPVLNEDGTQRYSSETVPTKIRQLIAYIIYYYEKYDFDLGIDSKKWSQKDILAYFGFQPNITQKWGMQPLQVLEYENYEHPVNPAGYKGVKSGNLGKAIRYLEYQAGSYKNFVDLFGGSGTASTAVPFNKSKRYFCNELGDHNYIYLKVLNDKSLLDDFLTALLEVHENMKNGNFPAEISYAKIEYYEDEYRKNKKLKNKNGYSKVNDSGATSKVVNYIKKETLTKYDEVKNRGGSDYAVLTYWRMFRNIMWGIPFDYMLTDSATPMWSYETSIALSEFFVEKFSLNGVTRESIDGGLDIDIQKSKRIRDFLELDKKQIRKSFSDFHERFKHVSLSHGDALEIVKLHNDLTTDENILYYSDSPYLLTSGYDYNNDNDTENDTDNDTDNDGFSTDDMENLIKALHNSGQKFIFSCRYNKKPNMTDNEVLFKSVLEENKKSTNPKKYKKLSKYTEEELEDILSAFEAADDYNDYLDMLDGDEVKDKQEGNRKSYEQLQFMIYYENYKIVKYVFIAFRDIFGVDKSGVQYESEEERKKNLKTDLWVSEIKSDEKGITNEIMITNFPITMNSDIYEADTFDNYMKDLFEFYYNNMDFYDAIEKCEKKRDTKKP